jgi:MFS family permease
MGRNNKLYFAFGIILLEWYEFTIYNLMIPYGIFGGEQQTAIYFGFLVFACSFLARPVGSIYFAGIADRASALRQSLKIMVISTLCIGLFPPALNSIKAIWFACCKIAQGFALGGSYGVSYLSIYHNSKQNVNYKLSLVQLGWVVGMLIGSATILCTKLVVGNLDIIKEIFSSGQLMKLLTVKPSVSFFEFGWRVPFLFSGLIGSLMYFSTRKRKPEVVKLPDQSPFSYAVNYFRNNSYKFITVFLVVCIEMVISHIWFTYTGVTAEANNSEVSSTIASNLRLLILFFTMPLCGIITDKINKRFGKLIGNYTVLSIVALSMILSAWFAPWSGRIWILLSALVSAGCYGSLIGWTISQFSEVEGQFIIGPLFNMTGAIVGGTGPLLATYCADHFGGQSLGIIMFIYGALALTCLWLNYRQIKTQA